MKDCNNIFICRDRTLLPLALPTNKVSPGRLVGGEKKKRHPTITLHVIVISNCKHLS